MNFRNWIIEETEDWIALNKPSGLLSIPDREGKEISLKQILRQAYGDIFTVHRLDRDTSGLIIFSKNEATHKILSKQFEERNTQKFYHGLVVGSPANVTGTIDAPIAEHSTKPGMMIIHRRGKDSQTDYEVIHDFGVYSWLRFRIHTGRTHQIRIHAKEIGHPIVCDQFYGDAKPILLSSLKHKKFKLSKNELEERPLLNRLALHASELVIPLEDGKNIDLMAPLAKDLSATLQQLTKWKGVK
jgi:23S rRNA pseudouridine1911/1915/1917 synthase